MEKEHSDMFVFVIRVLAHISELCIQCFSDVEQATIHNNKLCATQAFFELSGAYAVALWASVLIINLHMVSKWKTNDSFVLLLCDVN